MAGGTLLARLGKPVSTKRSKTWKLWRKEKVSNRQLASFLKSEPKWYLRCCRQQENHPRIQRKMSNKLVHPNLPIVTRQETLKKKESTPYLQWVSSSINSTLKADLRTGLRSPVYSPRLTGHKENMNEWTVENILSREPITFSTKSLQEMTHSPAQSVSTTTSRGCLSSKQSVTTTIRHTVQTCGPICFYQEFRPSRSEFQICELSC